MNEFFTAVKTLLERLGMKNIEYNASYTTNCISVVGCEYYAYRKRQNGITVEVDGKKFNLRKDASLLVAHIIESLPKKLEKKKKEENEEKFKQEARALTKSLDNTNISVTTGYENDEFRMIYRHKDKATLMAAIDYLQDGGFCSQNPDVIDEKDFMMNHMVKLWDKLSIEDKKRFLEYIDVKQMNDKE